MSYIKRVSESNLPQILSEKLQGGYILRFNQNNTIFLKIIYKK